jgi:cysteine desulfurase
VELKPIIWPVLGFAKAHGDSSRRKILVSSIEHLSVIHAAESLAKYGFEVVKIPVDGEGFVDLGCFILAFRLQYSYG